MAYSFLPKANNAAQTRPKLSATETSKLGRGTVPLCLTVAQTPVPSGYPAIADVQDLDDACCTLLSLQTGGVRTL
jgi:hypothetical protein